MTTQTLKGILFVNSNRVLEVTDEQFNLAFKPEQFKRAYGTHGELLIESITDHLNRFLKENEDVKYYSIVDGGITKHFFKKVTP